MDLGGNRRGVDMGPSAIRYAGLRDRLAGLGYSVRDRGNVRVADRDEGATKNFRQVDKTELAKMDGRAHHVDEIIRVAMDLAKVVADIERAGNISIVLGGDHSMAMGTLADIDRLGMSGAMEKAIAVASKGDGIHLSLDMDAIDPDEAPGVGTPVRGGLTYREAQLAMEMLAASGKLRSLEIAEVNPILDQGNRTAALAVELVASALGQTIL